MMISEHWVGKDGEGSVYLDISLDGLKKATYLLHGEESFLRS
jgi:hypothetical protein